MLRVEVTADSRFQIDRARIRETVRKILEQRGVKTDVVVSVAIVGNRKMAALNQRYMKRSGSTDVLSFPFQDPNSQKEQSMGFVEMPGEKLELGDIIVSFPEAVRQAREKNILVDQEIDNLIIHGLKHLLGEHHE